MTELASGQSAALMPTYGTPSLSFVEGRGSWLTDTRGRAYLDFMSGIAVTAFGHAHPHLVKALTEQGGKLWHTSNAYGIPGQVRAAERLVEATFADQVFFANSGAEALEGCFKIARRYHWAKGAPQRTRIITLDGAFHGRTLAAIAATGTAKVLDGYGEPVKGFDKVPAMNMNALRNAIDEETAAVLLEPVQGESGVTPLPADYLADVRAACDEFGLLLIADEVQCGMMRTGTLLAHQQLGVKPDLVALAKGLGGGFPVGAILATQEAASGMAPGSHGTTFGGNPLAMAVVNAVLDLMLDPELPNQVTARASELAAGLKALVRDYSHLYVEARGLGLMRALEVREPQTNLALRAAAEAEGLVAVTSGRNSLRLLPPLNVSAEEVAQALSHLRAASETLAREV